MQMGSYMLNTILRYKLLGKSIPANPASHAKNMRRLDFGIELNVVAAAAPDIARIAQEIMHLVNIAFHGTKLIDRDIDIRMLFAMGIKIDDDQNDVVACACHFPITQDRVIIRVIEAQIIVKMKRAIFAPDSIEPPDPILDVSRRVPIPLLELILLGIQIFLATGQSVVFAQFVAAVDAVESGERGREGDTNHESRPAAVLK